MMDSPKLNVEETMKQKIHELKLALDTEKSLRVDCQAELERLLGELSEKNSQIDAVKIPLENEIRSLKDKIINLTNENETERLSFDEKIRKLEENLKSAKTNDIVFDENDEYKKAIDDLINEKQLRSDLEEEFSKVKEEMGIMAIEKSLLEQNLKEAVKNLEETREALEIKKANLAETLAALKEEQEEKAMLASEVDLMKAGPKEDLGERGNSLFKEVEDNRKKLAVAYNTLKNKYVVLKNMTTVKNQEINRLKAEISSLKAQDLGLENALQKSKGGLYESFKKRIQELETTVHMMEKWKETPQILTLSESDVSNLEWVHSIVNQARNETRKAIADYQKLSSEQMAKAFALRNSELELMNLKREMVRRDGLIEKLELEVADLKNEAKENITQIKTRPEDTFLTVKNGNKTVRFADYSLEETLCNQENTGK